MPGASQKQAAKLSLGNDPNGWLPKGFLEEAWGPESLRRVPWRSRGNGAAVGLRAKKELVYGERWGTGRENFLSLNQATNLPSFCNSWTSCSLH